MEIKRQQEVVEAFHYDMRTQDMEEVETDLRVGFSPIESTDENYPKENSIIAARLEFRLVFEEYLLSGSVSQINHIINHKIETQDDISQEEVDELVSPLFDIVQRMAYEVTEIALDKPGIQLNFQSAAE
ncbi:hypothetical protein UAW_00455 [Enterococcus haemoperoxidus ATCC BAA-382]|uniref:Uncharacterized protein n=1 Tax=Enterococcus haemoperoxidus ATCC BAA-382 TaxID=1158608 RepID=R2SVP4_9ENTE|nr:DUF1149 family protein [Enterococcus haemoperoxidus]EOH99305.1 hypothetical protein UAW_00455 [Enterococcus haemoperoxidus ATCC BAA-382]EOT62954.1 hypothetical protein I583_01957 [Enterococcus haemoperoxidus ATCC BAA-382]OJG54688.1 hypothetical protein RV06_GL002647 [Enterococcus haemoperoxidus]